MNTEQTKKCRECQTDIPKKARRCPNCRTKQGIGVGGLIVATFFIVIMISVVSSTLDSVSSTNTYTSPAKVSTFELGTYIVEAEDFDLMEAKEVNLWQSYSNRTKLGSVSREDVVEVTAHDDANDYCKVATDTQTGWLACGWLIKQ